MERTELAGRSTTRVGFGGSLLGSTSATESRSLLAAAYDAGIRHFDVAPMYGFGQSESLLRGALGPRLRNCTITTKYGLLPPSAPGVLAPVGRVARRLVRSMPALRARLRSASGSKTASDPPLTELGARESLERSLRLLGVGTIDLFLLHEATPERLLDPKLLVFLERCKAEGKIREFGIGSRSERVRACLATHPEYCRVLQYEWSALAPAPSELEMHPHLCHGSLGEAREGFMRWLRRDATRCRRWSAGVGKDVSDPAEVAALLFKAALVHHRSSILLFSTRSVDKITANVASAEDDLLSGPARTFLHLVRSEYLEGSQSTTALF